MIPCCGKVEAGVGFKLWLARVNAPLTDGDQFCDTSALPSSTAEKTERFVRPIWDARSLNLDDLTKTRILTDHFVARFVADRENLGG
jgi:hypothetical protein